MNQITVSNDYMSDLQMEMVFNQHDTEKGVSSLSIILKSNASGGEFTTLNSKEILLLL